MDQAYTVSVRRSKRAKRISLHIHPQGVVELVLPMRASERTGAAFIRSKHHWISRALSAQKIRSSMQKSIQLVDGAILPCFGEELTLSLVLTVSHTRSSCKRVGNILVLRSNSLVRAERALEKWMKKKALDYFVLTSREYARMLGASVARVRVIAMKTQWGSCNRAKRALTFNWKLALAPVEIAQYVVVHEVAHLVQANHSKAFWRIVATLDPLYVKHLQWLKMYGGSLYIENPSTRSG